MVLSTSVLPLGPLVLAGVLGLANAEDVFPGPELVSAGESTSATLLLVIAGLLAALRLI